jgi:AcrR family transcriptional regulator
MTTFQRARSEEQREVRRRAILGTAAAMLAEMPVAEVTLNELSRRVGLAKSNVLRYFESREAVLLELLDHATREWIADLAAQLPGEIDARATAAERGDQLAAAFARSVAPRRVLCDLISAQAGVLEHNVSTETVIRYKRAMLENYAALIELIRSHLPELTDEGASAVCAMALLFISALWSHTQPPESVLAAYDADPTLTAIYPDFTATLQDTLATLVTGTLTRAGVRKLPD